MLPIEAAHFAPCGELLEMHRACGRHQSILFGRDGRIGCVGDKHVVPTRDQGVVHGVETKLFWLATKEHKDLKDVL